MVSITMEIARADESDYQGILDLQSRYFVGNLSGEERKEGFLSAEFARAQIVAMASDLGIVVCREAMRVVACMCASRLDFAPRPPIIDAMFRSIENEALRRKLLTEGSTFVYGPVCIDREYRHKGLLLLMFSALKKDLADRFEFGVCFVAVENHHSFETHTLGLGMTEVAIFEHGGKQHHTLAFTVRQTQRGLL